MTTCRRRPCSPNHQRGAALLMAMMILTLVATLASAMVWQQWRAVQVEAAERSRAQSAWILSGALDWSRLILREDARNGGTDHLGEPWAVPLAEARLSTFLAADKSNTDDGPEAFLSGSISDAQARYNLNNLVQGGKVSEIERAALRKLFDAVGVAPDLADRLANGLRDASGEPPAAASAPGGAAAPRPARTGSRLPEGANPPLAPQTLSQLVWLGLDDETVRRISPYVVLLPRPTPVNINTAPREVLVAAIDGLDLGSAERLTQARQRKPFQTLADAKALLAGETPLESSRVSVTSEFFEVRGRLRLSERTLEEIALMQRVGIEVVPLQRRRVSSFEGGGG